MEKDRGDTGSEDEERTEKDREVVIEGEDEVAEDVDGIENDREAVFEGEE